MLRVRKSSNRGMTIAATERAMNAGMQRFLLGMTSQTSGIAGGRAEGHGRTPEPAHGR